MLINDDTATISGAYFSAVLKHTNKYVSITASLLQITSATKYRLPLRPIIIAVIYTKCYVFLKNNAHIRAKIIRYITPNTIDAIDSAVL